MIIESLFWFSAVMILYVYLGYPTLAWLLSRFLHQKVSSKPYNPSISILIAAYNEEEHIGQTITNKLQLDYPVDKLEIIVVSDDSTDSTNAIVESIADERVNLLRQHPRSGKTAALNMAVPIAQGDIIVFSDANSIYAPDALKHLVSCFADKKVGYVTGKMIYTNPDGTPIGDGCSAYMKYENKLRELETNLGSVVGVDGGIDAMRKELYSTLNPDQLPDFVQPLKVVEKGFRVIYEPAAILKEAALKEATDEYKMRVRVSLRALRALSDMRQLLYAKAGLLFTWQLWSHKVLRYFCFAFLFAAFFSNLALIFVHQIYLYIFLVQVATYAGAAISMILERRKKKVKLLYFLNYFVLLNIASAHAFYKFLMGEKQVVWTPRKG